MLVGKLFLCKVEKILKGSLNLIPSPSLSKFVDIPQQCFALFPQVNFPANNLNFHWRWRWWDQIQAIFLNLSYFTRFLWVFIILEGYIDFVPTTYSVLASQCIENEAYNNSYIYVLQKLCSSSQLLLVFSRVFVLTTRSKVMN